MERDPRLTAIAALMALSVFTGGCSLDIEPQSGEPQSGGTSVASATGVGSGGGGAGAGVGGAGAGGSGGVASRCVASAQKVSCPYEKQSIPAQGGVPRDVLWQVPLGAPPANGSPVVLLFQGSFYGPPQMFEATADGPFGSYHMALTIKSLLDAGYAVLAPAAHAGGTTFWDTNVLPYSFAWSTAPDHAFMVSIFESISAGLFGSLDTSRMFAAGISSGGYMTSRMAVSYPGKFLALAIHSASYATCSGSICAIPDALPSDHPPTLFLHGEADAVAPVSAMKAYNARLVAEGKETRVVVDPSAGHEWIAAGPGEVVAWFDAHL